MGYNEAIFQQIKAAILEILPNAEVSLFGSRANDEADEESDWDILILTHSKPDGNLKKVIHNKLFPISINIAAFINTILVSKTDWNDDPSYYALRKSISATKVMA